MTRRRALLLLLAVLALGAVVAITPRLSREQFIILFWITPGLLAFVPHLYSLREAVYNRRAVPAEEITSHYIAGGMIWAVGILMAMSAITVVIGIGAITFAPVPQTAGAPDPGPTPITVVTTIGLCVKEILAAVLSGGLARWLYRARMLVR